MKSPAILTESYPMSNDLFLEIKRFVIENKMSFKDLCKQLELPEYFLNKILDRKIKMSVPYWILIKISKKIGLKNEIEIIEK